MSEKLNVKKITDQDRRQYLYELAEEMYNVLMKMETIDFDAEIHAFQEFTITIEHNEVDNG